MQTNVAEWLKHTAERMPDKTALEEENGRQTYKEYHDKSLGIAKAILASGLKRKQPVAVYMEKSMKTLVSFMGVARSGNFYSPIDTDMPVERAKKILEILRPGIIITTHEKKQDLDIFEYKGQCLYYEDISAAAYDQQVERAEDGILTTDLLYVLFTSGSTGMPKGVCITHGGVIDYIDWVTETFHISFDDSFGNQAPFYFDNSILDIYAAMKTGAALHIIPQKLFSQPVPLLEYLKEKKINTIFWVPSALMVVSKLKALKKVNMADTLKRVMFCGEVMPNKQLNIWRHFLPDAMFVNLYGPTEITDACTYYIVDRQFADDEPLPIGVPIKNTGILVLDEQDRLITESGRIGELCVQGVGVAKGYYGNLEKTREVFVQNPLNRFYDEKIYRTGDLVQYNENHELIYLSRKDFQIKHMGHRIELGEIETAVSSLSGITMCCCLYDEKRCKIVLFLDREIKCEEINHRLKEKLPRYMLPGKVVFMEEFPLNANGKIDRVRLKEYL